MTEQEPQQGGVKWEIDTALADFVSARASGDATAEATALRRFSEGLRNAASAAAGQVLKPLTSHFETVAAQLESSVVKVDQSVLTTQLDRLERTLNNTLSAETKWRAEERQQRDAQRDALGDELTKLEAIVLENNTLARESAARLGKLQEGQDVHGQRLDRLEQQHDKLIGDFKDYTEEFNARGALITGIQQQIDDMHKNMLGDELDRAERQKLTADVRTIPELRRQNAQMQQRIRDDEALLSGLWKFANGLADQLGLPPMEMPTLDEAFDEAQDGG